MKSIKDFIKEHKKEVIVIGGTIVVLTGTTLLCRNIIKAIDSTHISGLLDPSNINDYNLINPKEIKAAFATVEYFDGSVKVIDDIGGLADIMSRPSPIK